MLLLPFEPFSSLCVRRRTHGHRAPLFLKFLRKFQIIKKHSNFFWMINVVLRILHLSHHLLQEINVTSKSNVNKNTFISLVCYTDLTLLLSSNRNNTTNIKWPERELLFYIIESSTPSIFFDSNRVREKVGPPFKERAGPESRQKRKK